MDDDPSGDMTHGGGQIIDAKHQVAGRYLEKNNDKNEMNWMLVPFGKKRNLAVKDPAASDFYIDGGPNEDPDHAGLLYDTLGVQVLPRVFSTIRTNKIDVRRYTKKTNEEDYHTISGQVLMRFVPFSGEMTISIKDADTTDGLGLNVEIDLIGERLNPAKTITRLANSNAYINSVAEEIVNLITGVHTSSSYFGKEAADRKKELAAAFEAKPGEPGYDEASKFRIEVLDQLGFGITAVNIRSVEMKPEHRLMIEQKVTAEKTAEAETVKVTTEARLAEIRAGGQKKAQMLINEADADRVQRVLTPIAASQNMTQLHNNEVQWAAYEKNTTVTVFAPGNDKISTVPLK